MALGVERRFRLARLIHGASRRLVALVEEPGADQLAVAEGSVEAISGIAGTPPGGRGQGEGVIDEAGAGGVDPSVEDADDYIGGERGEGPEAGGGREAEESGGAGGVGLAAAVGEDSEDGGEAAKSGSLAGGEARGKPGGGAGVVVEEVGGRPAR